MAHLQTDADQIYEVSGAVFSAFASRGEILLEMALKKANLEDVFLELTEKSAETDERNVDEKETDEKGIEGREEEEL